MPFSLSGGLSAMGQTIANTTGDMMMTAQRADLDRQRLQLAEQLATTRETTVEGMREQSAKDLIPLQAASQIKVNSAQSADQIAAHIAETKSDTENAISKLKQLSTPDMLKDQRAIALATTIITPQLSVQVKDDGTAMTFNPVTGKTAPLTDPGTGEPVKFQNPAIAQAVATQTMTLKDAGNNLDRMYKSDMDAARVLHKDDSPEDQQKALDQVQRYYRPKIEEVNRQLMSLTAALGTKTGINTAPKGPPAGAPPLSSFLGGNNTGATSLLNPGSQ